MSDTFPGPQHPYVGVILLLIQDGRLLLQQRAGNDDLQGFYAPVAGKVDRHESPMQAIIREAWEEAGLVITPADLSAPCVVHWREKPHRGELIDVVEFYFQASNREGIPSVKEPDRALSIDFYPVDNLPQNTVTSIAPVLKALADRQSYLEWQGPDRI